MTAAFIGLLILMTSFVALKVLGFILVVFLMGMLARSYGVSLVDKEEVSIANIFTVGFLFTLTISQFFLVPWTLYFGRVGSATLIWWVFFFVLCVFSVIRCRKDIEITLEKTFSGIKTFFLEKKCGGLYGILATFFIALQLVGSLVLYHYDDDDSMYVSAVATNVADDTFWQIYGPTGEDTSIWDMSQYLTNGWYDLLTIISKTTKIPAAILMHTILPVLMIALAYGIVTIFAKKIIKRESQRYLFLLFVSLINILNNVSSHTSSSVLLMRMHQGKALFANIIVPVMFCVFLRMWDSVDNKKNFWLLVMANTCACAFSTTGLAFGAMLIFVFAVVYAVYNKSVKKGILTVLTTVPNVIFAAIYVLERTFEVWRW